VCALRSFQVVQARGNLPTTGGCAICVTWDEIWLAEQSSCLQTSGQGQGAESNSLAVPPASGQYRHGAQPCPSRRCGLGLAQLARSLRRVQPGVQFTSSGQMERLESVRPPARARKVRRPSALPKDELRSLHREAWRPRPPCAVVGRPRPRNALPPAASPRAGRAFQCLNGQSVCLGRRTSAEARRSAARPARQASTYCASHVLQSSPSRRISSVSHGRRPDLLSVPGARSAAARLLIDRRSPETRVAGVSSLCTWRSRRTPRPCLPRPPRAGAASSRVVRPQRRPALSFRRTRPSLGHEIANQRQPESRR